MARVQVAPLQGDDTLRPAAVQSDTFAQPQQPMRDNDLENLSRALAAFSGSVGNLGGVMQKDDEDARRAEEAQILKHYAGMTPEEIRKERDSGRGYEAKFKQNRMVVGASEGNAWAETEATKVTTYLQTEFDWDKGDPQKYLTEHFQKSIEESGLTDPNAVAAASRFWQGFSGQVRNQEENYRTKKVVDTTADTVYREFGAEAKRLVSSGAADDAIVKDLMKFRSNLGPRSLLGAGPQMVDREQINAAAALAETNPDAAIGLLDAEFSSGSGKTSLSQMREYQSQVEQIKLRAVARKGEMRDEAYLASVDAQDDQNLADGNLYGVTDITWKDHKGNEQTITAKDRKERALQRSIDRSPEVAKDRRESPTQTFNRELNEYKRAGVDHPRAKAAVKDIALSVSLDTVNDPDVVEKTMERINTARSLEANSRNTYVSYTTEADRDFLDAFNVAKYEMKDESGRQMSDAQAIERALAMTSPNKVVFTRDQRDAIQRAVNRSASGTFLGIFGTSTNPQNSGAVNARVTKVAEMYVRGGMDPDTAVKKAGETVKRNSITYRGSLLPSSGVSFPDNYKEVLDDWTDEVAKANEANFSAEGINTKGLTIVPAGDPYDSGGRYALVDEDGDYVQGADGGAFFITVADMRKRSASKADKAAKETINKASKEGFARANGLTQYAGKYLDKQGNVVDLIMNEGGKPSIKKTGQRARRRAN